MSSMVAALLTAQPRGLSHHDQASGTITKRPIARSERFILSVQETEAEAPDVAE